MRETFVVGVEDPLNLAWTHPWRVDPCGVITVERACADEPRLREVMKWYDAEHRYVRCELMVCTQPTQDSDLQVFGLFVLDVEEYARRGARPIEQDFLVRSKRGRSPTVYYSGVPTGHPLGASGFWQDMTAFCLRVGTTGDYGCRLVKGGRWETPDHWLPINATLFDSRPELRAEVTKALEKARVLIEVRAMGAMPPAEKREPGSDGHRWVLLGRDRDGVCATASAEPPTRRSHSPTNSDDREAPTSRVLSTCCLPARGCHACAFMTCGTPPRRCCWRRASIHASSPSDSATPRPHS